MGTRCNESDRSTYPLYVPATLRKVTPVRVLCVRIPQTHSRGYHDSVIGKLMEFHLWLWRVV